MGLCKGYNGRDDNGLYEHMHFCKWRKCSTISFSLGRRDENVSELASLPYFSIRNELITLGTVSDSSFGLI